MQINELNQDLEKIEEEEPQIIQDDLEAGGDQSLLDDQLWTVNYNNLQIFVLLDSIQYYK